MADDLSGAVQRAVLDPRATGQVEVYSPEGKRGTIPVEQADDAMKQGYKRADEFIRAIHPTTGKTGLIPKEQWGDAQMQGYMMDPRDQARMQTNPAALYNKLEKGSMAKSSVVSPFALPGVAPSELRGMTEDQPMSREEKEHVSTVTAGAMKEGLPMLAANVASEGAAGLPALARMAATGGAAAGTGLALGQSPSEAGKTALVQGVLPEAGGAVISKTGELAEKIAPALIKNLIKPSERMFAYGKDPVKFVSELSGGIPGDKAELAKQVFQELENTGNQITSRLKEVENAFPNAPGITKLDVGRAVNAPIDRKIAEISADRGMEASVRKGILEKLEDFRSGIMTDAAGKAQPTVVKLTEANTLKQQIGKSTNWKPSADAIEAKAQPIVNALRKEIYSNIRQGIEDQASKVGVNDLKELNLKYGSGLDAMKSIEKRLNTGPVITMSDLVTALGSPTAAVVKKALATTPGAIASSRALKSGGAALKGSGTPVGQLLRTIAEMIESGGSIAKSRTADRQSQQ
jgi:hypothetical protein